MSCLMWVRSIYKSAKRHLYEVKGYSFRDNLIENIRLTFRETDINVRFYILEYTNINKLLDSA